MNASATICAVLSLSGTAIVKLVWSQVIYWYSTVYWLIFHVFWLCL